MSGFSAQGTLFSAFAVPNHVTVGLPRKTGWPTFSETEEGDHAHNFAGKLSLSLLSKLVLLDLLNSQGEGNYLLPPPPKKKSNIKSLQ